MSRKVSISFFIFFFLCCNIYAASTKPPELLEVDFGSVTAMKTVHQAQSFSLPVNALEPVGVEIATSGLINYQNNERIPVERINLSFKSQTVVMSSEPLSVNLDGLSINKKFEINFDLDLEPVDRPGVYQGMIQFRFWEIKQNQKKWYDPIQVSLKVQVESWITIDTDAHDITLAPGIIRSNRRLERNGPVLIQVASNTNWQLSSSITTNNPESVSILEKVDDSSKQFQGIGQISISLEDGYKLIATGPATVKDESFTCIVPVDIFVTDYSRYRAGKCHFKVHFLAEIFK